MKTPKFANPLDALTSADFNKLHELEACSDLDFLKAVEILGLNPESDFKNSNLSGISFQDMDLLDFDFTGAELTGGKFQKTRHPKGYRHFSVSREIPLLSHESKITSLSFSNDGGIILSTSLDGMITIWDTHTCSKIHSIASDKSILKACFSPNGSSFFTLSENGDMKIWDADSGRKLYELAGSEKNIQHATYFQGDLTVLAFDKNDRLTIVDAKKCAERPAIEDLFFEVDGFSVSKSKRLLFLYANQGAGYIWDCSRQEFTASALVANGRIHHASFSENDDYLVVSREFGGITLWLTEGLDRRDDLGNSTDKIVSMSFVFGNSRVATTYESGITNIYDTHNSLVGGGQASLQIVENDLLYNEGMKCEFSSDGSYAVAFSNQSPGFVWSTKDGVRVHTLSSHNNFTEAAWHTTSQLTMGTDTGHIFLYKLA